MHSPTDEEIEGALISIISDGFNRSLGALRHVGAVDTTEMERAYAGVGSRYYDLVTQEISYTANQAIWGLQALFAGQLDKRRESKPAHQLIWPDFLYCRIWEWVGDSGLAASEDESFVRPTNRHCIPLGEFRQFLVAANATLKNGTNLPACVEVTVQGRRVRCVPLFLLLGERQLSFESTETERLLSRYTKAPDNRPVKWALGVAVEGEDKLRKGRVRRTLHYVLASFLVSWAERKLRKSSRP